MSKSIVWCLVLLHVVLLLAIYIAITYPSPPATIGLVAIAWLTLAAVVDAIDSWRVL